MTNLFRNPDDLVDLVRQVISGKPIEEKTELDPVNKNAVKKKFDDRKDQDIDNDGDVDSTDKYLHKRRKAISKALNEKEPKKKINASHCEEVELDEADATVKQQKSLKALMTKALGGKRLNPGYKSSIADNGDFVVADGGGRIVGRIKSGDYKDPMKEEVELDEANPNKMKDDVLKSRIAQLKKSDQKLPSVQFELKRLEKEMKKRGIIEEDASNFNSAVVRIKKANSVKDLEKLEKSLERIYNQSNAFTVKEFGRLDSMIVDKKIKLEESKQDDDGEDMTAAQKSDMDGDGMKDKGEKKKKKKKDHELDSKPDTIKTEPDQSDTKTMANEDMFRDSHVLFKHKTSIGELRVIRKKVPKLMSRYDYFISRIDRDGEERPMGKIRQAKWPTDNELEKYVRKNGYVAERKMTDSQKLKLEKMKESLQEAEGSVKVKAGPLHDKKVKDTIELAQMMGLKVTLKGKSGDGKMTTIHLSGNQKKIQNMQGLRGTGYFEREGYLDEDKKELGKISKELAGASKMHKGQSDRVKKIVDKMNEARGRKPKEDDTEDGGNSNLLIQLRKAVSLRGNRVRFTDGKSANVSDKDAQKFLSMFNKLSKPAEKEMMMKSAMKSHLHFKNALAGKIEKPKSGGPDLPKLKSVIEEVEMLDEGVNDPAIFKAVFLAGGPGSGKSFIVGKTGLVNIGMKLVNSDDEFERRLKNAGLDKSNPDDIYSPKGQVLRGKAKKTTKNKQDMYITGRLGLVIDGTGKDADKMIRQRKELEDLGYDTAMIFVDTDLETSMIRNRDRDRKLPDAEVKTMWKEVQSNKTRFKSLFGKNFAIVDNTDQGSKEANLKLADRETLTAYKKMVKFANATPTKQTAKNWIKNEKSRRGIKEANEKIVGIDRSISKDNF